MAEWKHIGVGCHWERGPFTVSTVQTADRSKAGYLLVKDCQINAEYIPWLEVERLVSESEAANDVHE